MKRQNKASVSRYYRELRFEKMISEHMIQSKNESVHTQMFIEADIANLSNWRKSKKVFTKRKI